MLKGRIAIVTIAFALSLPSLSSASPLSWVPGPRVLAKLAGLWNLLPGHPGTAPLPASDHRKNGAGMDPNGTPTSPSPNPDPAGATAGTPDSGQ
jgi:hypothetical protein